MLDDDAGFPSVLAKGPGVRIISPGPGNRPGAVLQLGPDDMPALRVRQFLIACVEYTAPRIDKLGGFAYIGGAPS